MPIFGICFILYFLKLSACRGFWRIQEGSSRSLEIYIVCGFCKFTINVVLIIE